MEAEARRELARLAADGLDPFRSRLWLGSLAYLADACAALGDEAVAALLYPELERFGGENVMIGHLVACYGAADRYLGMLAATLGEAEVAEAHFERALELNRRMGARTWVAHTAYEYARFLLARRRGGPERAGALLGEAAALAERIGMQSLLGRIRALGSPVTGSRAPRRSLPARGAGAGPRGPGAEQPRARPQAVDQRAHGGQPRPQHPAQDGLRQPHRGRLVRVPARARARRSFLTPAGIHRYDRQMPLYMIERTYADQLDITDEDIALIDEINADEGVRWLFSFLSADRRRTYCLYEAPSPEAIVAAARRADVPVDEIVEVGSAAPQLTGRLQGWAEAQPSA